MTAVTARPSALLTAADEGADQTARWRRDAGELGDAIAAFRRGAVDVPVAVPDLATELERLADRTARLDDELRTVGEAFLAIEAPRGSLVAMSELQLDFLVGGWWQGRDVARHLADLRGILGDRHLDARGRAEAVRDILDRLPRTTLLALAARDPELIGNTDGVPVELRYLANRVSMTSALAAAETEAARRAARGDEVGGRLQGRIDNLRRLLHTPYGQLVPGLARTVPMPRQVLLFDPSGDGRAAEVFGDLSTATSIATIVPGITNRLDNFQNTSSQAENIYLQATDTGGAVATIAWLGYDTPEFVGAPSRITADVWAPVLAGFQAALPVSLGVPDARTTVIAHSYGSLLTGIAIREEGLMADAFAVIGSPGMNVAHASQLGLPDGVPLYAGRADRDPVSLSEGHGTDPAKPYFGAIAFETGGISGHSSYTQQESASLLNLAHIVLGNDDAVTRDGWDLGDLPSAPIKAAAIAIVPPLGGVLAGYEVVDEVVITARDTVATVREVYLDARDLAAGAVSLADEAWDEVVDHGGRLIDRGEQLVGDAVSVADDAWDGVVEGAGDLGSELWERTPWG